MNNKPFIFTTDLETAKLLIGYGFEMVSKDGAGYTFLNTPNAEKYICQFTHGQISYTNKLCI